MLSVQCTQMIPLNETILSTSTSYTLLSHLTTIAQVVCCIRKRENDRKVRSIVDRKPEKKSNFG